MNPLEPVIKFTNVFKSYKKDFWVPAQKVLNDVSFEVAKGKITGFMGVNGAGKTTCMKIILGLTKVDSGSATLSVGEGNPKQWTSFMPERPYYYVNMKGKDFVEYIGGLYGFDRGEVQKETQKWAMKLGIEKALDKRISTYSKGMLQRLGMVSCLVSRPRLLLLDEPMSGLDPLGRLVFRRIIREFHEQHQGSVFFSTHVLSDIQELCSDVVILKSGRVAYSGDLASFDAKGQIGGDEDLSPLEQFLYMDGADA